MFKRRRTSSHSYVTGDVGDNLEAQVVFPPLESTILIDTGGSTGLQVSNFSSSLTGNLGGVRRLQYNSPFWNKDFFTTTYQNTLAGLVVSCYNTTTSTVQTALFPLVLPRQLLTSQWLSSTTKNEHFFKLQQSVAYALNLAFSKPAYILQYDPGTQSSSYVLLNINDINLPILQTAELPPLLFSILPQTGQLCLRLNPNFSLTNYQFAFNIVTYQTQWIPSGYIANNNSIFGIESGWFGDGGYIFGFGQWNYETKTYVDAYYGQPTSFFTDLLQTFVITVGITNETWTNTILVPYLLNAKAIVAHRTTSCISSRYLSVRSTQLARLQLRPLTGNLDSGMTSIIGLIYNNIDNAGTFQSGTQSIDLISAPAIFYDPKQSHSETDIELVDEFGNQLYSFTNATEPFYLAYYENNDDSPATSGPVPAVYKPLDPYFATNAPTNDCLFPYYKINQAMILNNIIPLNVSGVFAAKPSAYMAHFIRAIGS